MKNSELFSPGLKPNKYFKSLELFNYHTLKSTFNNQPDKGNYTDRLDNFIQRFSQELNLDSDQKQTLKEYKKRFSLEDKEETDNKYQSIKPDGFNK